MVGGRRIGSFQGEGGGKKNATQTQRAASQPAIFSYARIRSASRVKFAYMEISVRCFFTQTEPNQTIRLRLQTNGIPELNSHLYLKLCEGPLF